jgi:predicted nucleic acid-binding protein
MVLVDTSVWIRFLAGREPFASTLSGLLCDDDVAGHEFVYGELLIGDRGGRGRLLALYAQMDHVRTVSHAEVVEFVRHRNLQGLGVGWIDLHLLASAVVARCQLWTADPRFAALASRLGVAYA